MNQFNVSSPPIDASQMVGKDHTCCSVIVCDRSEIDLTMQLGGFAILYSSKSNPRNIVCENLEMLRISCYNKGSLNSGTTDIDGIEQ